MTQVAYTFDGVTLPPYDSRLPLGLGRVGLRTVPLKFGGALNPLGSTGQAIRQGGRYRYRGTYQEATIAAVQTDLDAIGAKLGNQGALYKQLLSDSSLRWVYAVLADWNGDLGPEHVLFAGLDLEFEILSPWWNGETQHDESVVDLFDASDDVSTTGGDSASSGTITIGTFTNSGNKPQRDILIDLTAGTGNVTGMTLTNSTTGHVLAWAGTLASAKILSLNCGSLSITNGGANAYSELTPPTNKEAWMEFAPGANVLTLSLTEAGELSQIRFRWYDAWA